jgi:hypothetical protein
MLPLPPAVHFSEPPTYESLAPIAFWSPPPAPRIDASQCIVASLLNELRQMPETDPRLPQRLADFDLACSVRAREVRIRLAHKIDTATRFAFFPAFDIPAVSSTVHAAELPVKPPVNVWQTRPFTELSVPPFEATCLTETLAAFVCPPSASAQRTLSLHNFGEPRDSWTSCRVDCGGRVEALAVDDRWAWMFGADRVHRTPLNQPGPVESVEFALGAGPKSFLAWKRGVVCASAGSSQIAFVSSFLSRTLLETRYAGIAALAEFGEAFLCAVVGSGSLRMIGEDGREARSFVAHCAPATGIAKLAETTFASRGDDASVRVWDIRERFPVLSICSIGPGVVNVAGSRGFVVSALRDRTMCVFDLRKPGGKPVLAVATQEYEPADLAYSEGNNRLTMFGVSDAEASMFPENHQQGQRIFRMYSEFVGARAS